MFDKLDALEQRFSELTEMMGDPTIASNPAKFTEIAKERARIEATVATYREYRQTVSEIDGALHILADETDDELRSMAKEEIRGLEKLRDDLYQQLLVHLLPQDPLDDKNVILEIRAGTGGDEASLFAADLFRMYSRYAESRKWKVEILSHHEGTVGGFKEVIALVSGERVYSELKQESGVHRVQRVPVTESQGRIHTSACTVAILPEAEDVDIDVADKDLRIDIYRSSGAGGQHVNTTDSAIRITHIPTGLIVTCQDERSQHKNKAKAMKILRSRLLELEIERAESERSAERKTMVGTGDRSERIRTYNYPQNRVTDHRIDLTLHKLEMIMEGDGLSDIIHALMAHRQAESMKENFGLGA